MPPTQAVCTGRPATPPAKPPPAHLNDPLTFSADALIRHSPDVIFSATPDGRVHHLNPRATAIFRLGSRRAVADLHLKDLFPPETAARYLQHIKAVFRNGKPCLAVPGTLPHSGRWIETGLVPARDAGGRVVNVIGVCQDVTGLRQAKQKLSESAALFDLLMKHSNDGINLCEFDPRTGRRRLVFGNACYARMSGRSLAALKKARDLNALTRLVSPAANGRGRKSRWFRCLLNGKPFSGLNAWNRPDGRYNRYQWTAVPFQQNGRYFILGVDHDVTRERKAEDALKDSEEKFKKAFASSPHMLVISTLKDGRIIEANRSALHRAGYKRREVIGRPVAELRLWSRLSDRRRLIRKIQRHGSIQNMEFIFRNRTGDPFRVSLSGRCITFDNTPCLLLVVQDITATHQAMEALRQSEEKFVKIFNSSPDMIIISTRAEGRYVAVNRAFERLTGHKASEVIGKTARAIAAWSNPEDRRRVLDTLRLRGHVRDMLLSYQKRSGEQDWTSVSAEPITLDGEDCILWVSRDVSERQRAEESLRFSERKYRLLAEATHDLVLEMDANGTLLSASRDSLKRIGWAPRQVAGRPFMDLVHRDDAKAVLRMLRAAGKKEQAGGEVRLLHRNGSWLWMNIRLQAVQTTAGDWRITGVLKDETQRKKMEAERQQLIWMLIHAQEKERQSISASLHDDLGQLLTLAKMELNSVEPADAGSGRFLKDALQNLDRTADSIRSLARSLHPPLLNDLGLPATLSMLAEQVHRLPGIQCTFACRGPAPGLARPEQVCLYRVMQEALSNAVRHSRASRITVTLHAGARQVTLRIRDNGNGFDATGRALEHGIGLRGMRERLIRLGGRLLIHSARAQGTVLSAILPLQTPSPPDNQELALP